jgi:tape measure domain-containing protein
VAFDIGELLAKLHIDPTQFNDEVAKAKTKMQEAGESAGRLHGAMSNVMQGIGMGVGNIAFQGLSTAVGFAKDAVFGFNAELQNSGIAFTTMLGSGQKAQVFLDQLKAFAKSTPFSFGDLVTNAQNMMGMGIAAKDVIPDLTALGDSVASVGGSAEQVKQVTLAFDQMAAKGTLDMGNMNQLMEGGVPNALKIMAAGYHTTTGAMIEMISTGKVQSSVALPLLVQGLEKGTSATAALGGMMDKQSQTFTGALSNIGDGLQQAIAGAFKPFFDVASSGAQALGTFFSSAKFSQFGDQAQAGMTKAFAAIKGFNWSPIISGFHTVVDVVKNDIIPVGQDIAKVFGPPVVTAFGAIYGAIGPVTSALKPVGDALKSIFDFMGSHTGTFQALAVGILAVVAAQKLWTIATQTWTMVTKAAAAAQVLLDAAMDANPIGLIVLAIIGLAAAFIYLWTHSAAFRDFFIGMWQNTWTFLKAIGAWFAGPFANFFVGAWNVIAGAALWLWHTILDPAWQGISAGAAFLRNIIVSFANLWAFLWRNTVGVVILWLWHNVWEPAAQGIASVALWLWQNVLVPVGHGIAATVQALGTVAMWLWHAAIEPAFHGIAAVATWLWGFISANFNAIKSAVTSIGNTFKSVFSAIGGYISSAFNGAVGIVKGAINGIIGAVNGAISGINSVINAANKIPGVNFPTVPSIPKLASGGVVSPSKGGTPVIMGDGGQVEYGVPKSDMQAIIGQAVQAAQGGGGTLTVIFKGDGILAGIRKQVRVQGGSAQTVLVGS